MLSHSNAPVPPAHAATYYAFAEQCMELAKNARSTQECYVYMRMAIQWFDAGARLQTCSRFRKETG